MTISSPGNVRNFNCRAWQVVCGGSVGGGGGGGGGGRAGRQGGMAKHGNTQRS